MLVYSILVVVTGFTVFLSYRFFFKFPTKQRKYQRESDTQKLSRQERKIYNQAKVLHEKGNILGAAQLLETVDLHREAISLLENKGMIKEAAGVLLRMGSQQRAGHVFARHQKWVEAAECFRAAKLPNKVAHCYKQAGELEKAVPFYIEANKILEAAECYHELGKLREAAKLYAKLGENSKTVMLYRSIISQAAGDAKSLKLSSDEIGIIAAYLTEGNVEVAFADIIVAHDKHTDIIISLIKSHKLDAAASLYLRSVSNIGPKLIAYQNFNSQQSQLLANLFLAMSNFEYAGIVFERLKSYELAAQAFDRDEDFQRAALCYDRAGLAQKSHEMLCKSAESGDLKDRKRRRPSPVSETNPFFIGFTTRVDDKLEVNRIGGETDHRPMSQPAPTENQESHSQSFSHEQSHPQPTEEVDEPTFITEHVPAAVTPLINSKHKQIFTKMEFLEDLNPEEIDLILNISQIEKLSERETLLEFNESPLGVYFVVTGAVQCYREHRESDELVDTIKAPGTFGEFWSLIDYPTQVKFVATENTEVHIVERDQFISLLDKNGTIARKLYRRFTQRLLNKLLNTDNYDAKKIAS